MTVCKNCDTENPKENLFCMQCGNALQSNDTIGGLDTPYYPDDMPATPKGASPAALEPGAVFAGRYTIIEKIGQGGMGTVYKASETLAGKERAIALKLIRPDRLADQRAMDKLVNEGALTQDIRHPNVVNVYNVGVHEGQPFVAMELVNGVSLRNWHRKQDKDVSFDTAAAIVRELINGLEAAHALDIIHRDLKPENIMLTAEPDGTDVKLQILDFGIARAPGTVDTGTGLGTPHYMAPEQITNPDSAGPPADFYSVFKIWYEMLMDVLPQGHWQPPSSGRPDVDPLVDQLIERGLSAKPSRRPQDVEQFRKWMRQAIPGFPGLGDGGADEGRERRPVPTPTPAPGPVTPTTGFTQKQMAIAGGVLLGGVALVIAIASGGGGGSDYVPEEEYWDEIEGEGEGFIPPDDVVIDPVIPAPTPMPTQSQLPPPPPPPRQITYSDLGGQWNVSTVSSYSVSVSGNGTFSGRGVNQGGMAVQIEGSLAEGTFAIGNQSAFWPGELQWDGACHISFRIFNANTTIAEQGQIHIDHAPVGGLPCPPRFGN